MKYFFKKGTGPPPAGMEAQRDEGGGRILLGDNTGDEAGGFSVFGFQLVRLVYGCVCVFLYVFLCLCVYIYICICIYIYIDTYI
jgi:hypothetical protein